MSDHNSHSSTSQDQVLRQLKDLTDAIQAHRLQIASAQTAPVSPPAALPVGLPGALPGEMANPPNQPNQVGQLNAMMQQLIQNRLAELNPEVTHVAAGDESSLADLEKRMGDVLHAISNRFVEMTNAIDARLRVLEASIGGAVHAPQTFVDETSGAEAQTSSVTSPRGASSTSHASLRLVENEDGVRAPAVEGSAAPDLSADGNDEKRRTTNGTRRKKRKARRPPDTS